MCQACSQPDADTGHGYYCPGAPSGGRKKCPAPFVFSDTDGNTSPEACYAKVTCGGKENKVTCKEWEVHAGQCKNDGNMSNDDTAANVQWTYSKYNQNNNPFYFTYPKRVLFYAEAVKPFGTNTALTDNSNNSDYHIEIRPDFSRNHTSGSPWEATVTNLACVKNIIPCNEFGPESCAHQTTQDKCNAKRFCKWVENQCKSKKSICEAKTNSNDCDGNEECIWLEYLDSSSKCAYINDVAISSNDANGQIQTQLNANTTLKGYLYANHGNGNAEWFPYTYSWDVSKCIGQNTNVSMDAHNCVGTQLHKPLDYEGGESRPIKVWSTEESIIFANINSHYYCTRCKGDDVDNNKYYYGDTTDSAYLTSDECYEDLDGDVRPKKTDGHVCKCTTVSERGYYRTGLCNSDNNWTSENDICSINTCPAGKTTTNLGPIVSSGTTVNSVCTYTKQTKFCDNTGTCQRLEELENQGDGWTFF